MTREELIARLEGGETGRDIDGAVAVMVDGAEKCIGMWRYSTEGKAREIEPFSTSLDAALALVERVRPKAWIEINGPRRYLNIPTPVPNYWKAVVAPWEDKTEGVGWAATPAAALIAALLKAEG